MQLGVRNPGVDAAVEVKKLLEASDWELFAETGLRPISSQPPSGPVLHHLLALLRRDVADKD